MEIGIAIVVFILVLLVVAIAPRKNRSTQESTPLKSEIAAEEKVAVQSQSKSSAGSDPNLFPDNVQIEERVIRAIIQQLHRYESSIGVEGTLFCAVLTGENGVINDFIVCTKDDLEVVGEMESLSPLAAFVEEVNTSGKGEETKNMTVYPMAFVFKWLYQKRLGANPFNHTSPGPMGRIKGPWPPHWYIDNPFPNLSRYRLLIIHGSYYEESFNNPTISLVGINDEENDLSLKGRPKKENVTLEVINKSFNPPISYDVR